MADTKFSFVLLIFAVLVCAQKISADDNEDDVDVSLLMPSELGNILESEDDGDLTGQDEVDDNPAPCCMPKIWSGKMHSVFGVVDEGRRKEDGFEEAEDEVNGKPKLVDSIFQVYVDQNNKRLAGKSFCPVSGNVTYSFIMLFKTVGNDSSATLYVFRESTKKCRTKNLPRAQFKPQCIPSNAKYEGAITLGQRLSVQSWGFFAKTRGVAVGGNIMVTPGTCIPVFVREFGSIRSRVEEDKPKPKPKPKRSGKAFAGSVNYYDIQLSIPDPSVFTPPSYCKTADDLQDSNLHFQPEDRNLESLLERFVR